MNRKEIIERTARIICENKLADCLCKGPSHYACTAYNKARDIVNMLVQKVSGEILDEVGNKDDDGFPIKDYVWFQKLSKKFDL